MNPEIILLTLLTISIILLLLLTCLFLYLDTREIKKTNIKLKSNINHLYNQIDDIKETNSKAFLEMYKHIHEKTSGKKSQTI